MYFSNNFADKLNRKEKRSPNGSSWHENQQKAMIHAPFFEIAHFDIRFGQQPYLWLVFLYGIWGGGEDR